MRLYDPTSGAITIDGIDLRDVSLASLTDLISVVPQEAFLLNDTVKQNLLLAKPAATDDELLHACKVRTRGHHLCVLWWMCGRVCVCLCVRVSAHRACSSRTSPRC